MRDIVWYPHGDYISNSRIRGFMNRHHIVSWQDLLLRSMENIEWFWPAALEYLGIEWFVPFQRLYDDSEGMPWTKWFIGGKLNITHNILDRHIRDKKGERTAIRFETDNGVVQSVSYNSLFRTVNALAAAMRQAGIEKGDRVAMCMSISPEAVAVMLASLKIGAVSVQPSARIAPAEIAEYLREADARLLFINDGYPRGGKTINLRSTFEAVACISSLRTIVVIERIGTGLAGSRGSVSWENFLSTQSGAPIPTESLDAEHPALILYSSGTTGKSKVVIHTHGGALAQTVKEIGFAFDCRENDTFFWATNIGWMMAPWEIIGALFFGATLVIYEGTHLYPTPHRMFELVEKHGITIFGFTPTAMRGLARLGEDFSKFDLTKLRILGSTGEVLDPQTWQWYFKTFGRERCPIMNISGGTELIGCLLSPLPVMPQKVGALGGPGLGMAIDIVDDVGNSVRREPGFLVCRKPFPSMTRGFLNNPELYLRTYFPKGPNLWVHGDRAEIDKDGFWFILGRTDDLIVRGGVKHDPAKIEKALLSFPGTPTVQEAAAIGPSDELRGQRIVCFVVTDGNADKVDARFLESLAAHVARTYDPLGRPDEIYAVKALPKNLAAKIPRQLLRKAFEGKELDDVSKIDDTDALENIRELGSQNKSRQ